MIKKLYDLKTHFTFIIVNLISVSTLLGQNNISISQEHEKLVHQALDSIYNLKFETVHQFIDKLENEIPEYPGLYLLKSYYLLWEQFPLKESNPFYVDF